MINANKSLALRRQVFEDRFDPTVRSFGLLGRERVKAGGWSDYSRPLQTHPLKLLAGSSALRQ
jgi:hypothetical protein